MFFKKPGHQDEAREYVTVMAPQLLVFDENRAVKTTRDAITAHSRCANSELISFCAVAINADQAPEWIELIPAGKFSAVDGRGPFENSDPDSIVSASVAMMPQVGLVLDYDRLAELDESGLTMREIAAELGVSPAFVCRALKARQRLPAPSFGD